MSTQIKQARFKTAADIVFCIDATGSMQPCFDGLRASLNEFVRGLGSAAQVDFRLRLLAYRDKHSAPDEAWDDFPFTSSVDEFIKQLSSVTPFGGADAQESSLDALYIALKSPWRSHGTHKSIILMTDADTHATLHPSTYGLPDNDVSRVITEFQTLRHVLLFMVVPEYPIYKRIEESVRFADRKIMARFVPCDDDAYEGLKAVNWIPLMQMIGQVVSATSIAVLEEERKQ